MMTAIIKERPKDPIKFLIDRLKKPESKWTARLQKILLTIIFLFK